MKGAGLAIGLGVVAIFLFVAIFAPYVAPYNPYKTNLVKALEGPSKAHPFGTDSLGRDLLSRIMEGTRYSLFIAIGSIAIVAILGISFGITAAYHNGSWLDQLVMGATELMIGIPVVVMAIIIVSLVPSKIVGLIIAVVAVYTPTMIRLTRSKALEIREEGYIEAAISIGAGRLRVMLRHMLPNTLTPIVVEATLRMGETIILISALSYIGLGVHPPTPEWGVLLSHGRDYMFTSSHLILFPGGMLSLLILGLNLLGEGLSERLAFKAA